MNETLTYTDYEVIYDTLNLYLDIVTPYDFESIEEYNSKTEQVREIIGKIMQGDYDLPY